jgi:hypothetical protein
MPAWTYNLLFVSGPQAEVDAFESAAKEPELDLDFSFRSLWPRPSAAPDAPKMSAAELREWTIENYGNKLGSGAAVLCRRRPSLLMYYFLSPWNQSNLGGISARFPLLELAVWYYREDGPEAMGVEILKAGAHLFSAEDEDCSGYSSRWKPFYAAALEELCIRHLAGRVGWADDSTEGRNATQPDSARYYLSEPTYQSIRSAPDGVFQVVYKEEHKQLLLAAARRRRSFISPVEELPDIWENVAAYGLDDDAAFQNELAAAMATTRAARLKLCLHHMDLLDLKAHELAGCGLCFSLQADRGFGFFQRIELRERVGRELLTEVEAVEDQLLRRTQGASELTPVLIELLKSHIAAGTVVELVRRSLSVYDVLRTQLSLIRSSVSVGELSWKPVGIFDHEELAWALNRAGYPLEDALVAMLGKTENGQYSDGWPL